MPKAKHFDTPVVTMTVTSVVTIPLADHGESIGQQIDRMLIDSRGDVSRLVLAFPVADDE